MPFKIKEKKKKSCDSRITLDATHTNKFDELTNNKEELQTTKKELIIKEKELLKLESKTTKTDKDYELEIILKDTITSYKEFISKNENLDVNYLLDNKDILINYYNTNDKNSHVSKKQHSKSSSLNQSIINYFNLKDTPICDKKDLFDEYLYNVNNDYINKNFKQKINICAQCNIEKTLYLSIGKNICHKCGDESEILIESDKPSYKDPPREVTYFSYKRINHFNEWLAQFQAKETTDIPKDIYEEILDEIKKERLDINKLSPSNLRSILKKIKKNKYYEHIPHILNKLNGINPPVMSPKIEEELRRMFKEIQLPFHKFCPKSRKNFLSYSYVLHKFVQLLELDEFVNCFILLKSREKLHQQDLIWKQICDYLEWEFIPSI